MPKLLIQHSCSLAAAVADVDVVMCFHRQRAGGILLSGVGRVTTPLAKTDQHQCQSESSVTSVYSLQQKGWPDICKPQNAIGDVPVDNNQGLVTSSRQQHYNNNNRMCEEDVEGVQSDFSGLSLKRPKYNDEDMDCSKAKTQAEAGSQSPSRNNNKPPGDIPSISAEEWCETDMSSIPGDVEQGVSSPIPIPVLDHNLVSVKRRHKKPVSRSKTDLMKRFSSSSDLSELSARLSRNSADLEKFFNEMGLEKGILDPLVTSGLPHTPSLLDNVSSVDSVDARSWCSDESQKNEAGPKSMDMMEKGGSTSVVERNARIIKWLCNVRKSASPPESEN